MPAWHPPASHAQDAGRFDLAVPAGWEVSRNRRWFGNDSFRLDNSTSRSTISLQLIRSDSASRRIPLDLLAETRALSTGRSLGIESAATRMDHVALDGHEAWAVTGQRRWRLVTSDFSTVVARVGDHVAILTLEAPRDGLNAAAGAWSVVLDSLRFPEDPVSTDAPQWDPEDDR